MRNPPSGTVTFLFTDIEGSTMLAREHPAVWDAAQKRHHQIMREAIESNNGYVFQVIGDAFCTAFHTAAEALKAALQAQQGLQSEPWGDCAIRVRMGIHTGEAAANGDEYQGYLTLSLVQRLMSAGHGGQILVSGVTENLLKGNVPNYLILLDLGQHDFKDVPYPVRIFQVVAPGLQTEFPALRTLHVFPNNLPAQLTSFIGREHDIQEIKQAILSHRLVTLTGVGGTGKTRLSLQVAIDLSDQFPNGVWLVELAGLRDPDLIPQTIRTTLGLAEQPGTTLMALLEDYLRNKKILLILDNCEHLIQECTRVTNTLLNRCPSLTILATSREPLGVAGEFIWHVRSLTLPDADPLSALEQLSRSESVQLFVERAALAQHHFMITPENAAGIVQICCRLDGIPLAIELAAARVRVLGVDQIAKRLDDRFRLLTGGPMALERHQTLRAAVDWSYNLLSSDEQRLLPSLSVFTGGWVLEAAEYICSGDNNISAENVIELLTHLVDKSLITFDGSRYRMLETTRQYAYEKLVQSEQADLLRGRHLAFYVALATQIQPKLRTSDRVRCLEELQVEADNFRAALEWSLPASDEQSSETSLQLASSLMYFWQGAGSFQEGRAWLDKALTTGSATDISRAQALSSAGNLAWFQGDYKAAHAYLEESVSLYRNSDHSDPRGLATALNLLAITCAADDLSLARTLSDESVALCRSLGPDGQWDLAGALFWNGEIASRQNDLRTASSRSEESLMLFRQLGDISEGAGSLYVLAGITLRQGSYIAAREFYQECLRLWQEGRNRWSVALTKRMLGVIDLALGNYEEARVHLEESITEWQEMGVKTVEVNESRLYLGMTLLHQAQYERATTVLIDGLMMSHTLQDKSLIALSLAALSVVAAAQNQSAHAARILGAAEAIVASLSPSESFDIVDRNEYEYLVTKLYSQLDQAVFGPVLAEGRVMTIEQAIALASGQRHGK